MKYYMKRNINQFYTFSYSPSLSLIQLHILYIQEINKFLSKIPVADKMKDTNPVIFIFSISLYPIISSKCHVFRAESLFLAWFFYAGTMRSLRRNLITITLTSVDCRRNPVKLTTTTARTRASWSAPIKNCLLGLSLACCSFYFYSPLWRLLTRG